MIMFMSNKFYKERLANLNLLSLKKHWLEGKPNECFKTLKSFMNVDANKLFSIDYSSRTRSNSE